MSKDDDGREEYEEGTSYNQVISLLIGLGILVYVGISQPFGQKIIGPMKMIQLFLRKNLWNKQQT